MIHLTKILACVASIILLLAQRDIDGAPLVAGWNGLLLVVGAIAFVGFHEVFEFIESE